MFWKEFVDELIDCLAHQELALLVTTPAALSTLSAMPVSAILVISSDPNSITLPADLPFGVPVSCYTFDPAPDDDANPHNGTIPDADAGSGGPVPSGSNPPGDATAHGYAVVFRHDVTAMATAAFDHLRTAGARRPALLATAEREEMSAIFTRAYLDWCDRCDISPLTLTTSGSATDVGIALDGIVDEGADGMVSLYAGSPLLLEGLARRRRRVPADFLLVVQAEGVIEDVLGPSITTVSFAARECAHICAETLVESMGATEVVEVTLPFHLTPRSSTDHASTVDSENGDR